MQGLRIKTDFQTPHHNRITSQMLPQDNRTVLSAIVNLWLFGCIIVQPFLAGCILFHLGLFASVLFHLGLIASALFHLRLVASALFHLWLVASVLFHLWLVVLCGYARRSRYPLPMRCGEVCLNSLAQTSASHCLLKIQYDSVSWRLQRSKRNKKYTHKI